MAKIIFVTGGVQSGKSRWAANYFGALDDVKYMCVYDELDKDVSDRINFNCSKHGISWDIRTGADNFKEIVKGHKFSILDNLAEYINRVVAVRGISLTELSDESRKELEKFVIDEVTELMWEVKELNGVLLILSAELSFCPTPADPAQEVYRKILGNVNQRIANTSSEVYLMVSGVPCKVK